MAGALASIVLEKLFPIFVTRDDFERKRDKELLELLRRTLFDISSTVDFAEERRFKDGAVMVWLDELKGALCDIDDFFDEWKTVNLKSHTEFRLLGKTYILQVTRSNCFCFSCNNGYYTRPDFARKLRKLTELNERLNRIWCERNNFVSSKHTTLSFINIAEVKGRDGDKAKIKRMLLSESSEQSNPHIICLVGMGGLGKTSLAKLVYHDNEVETHFEKRIWVSVPYFPSCGVVAEAILESLIGETPNSSDSYTLLEQVEQNLRGKKFFLVLDDVREENPEPFEELIDRLKYGSPGSKILVTTRKERTATMVDNNEVYKLGMLSTEDCWSIFSEVAFFGKTSGEYERLQGVGRKIVEKCNGLPLVAKTLGDHLHSKTFQEWLRVLYNEIWEVEKVREVFLFPLQLRYCDMPAALKQCFSFCAMFPKDYAIEKSHLIRLWIAQGYLGNTGDMNKAGEQYFHDLVERSFFQAFITDKTDGSIISCKMDDMVHHFAHSFTKYECYSIEINNPKELTIDPLYKEVRHSSIVFQKPVSFPDSVYRMKKLRTLLIESKGNLRIDAALPNLFNQLNYLRSLNLGRCGIKKIPSNINKLVLLRQLDLSFNRNLKKLPETFCELYNLLILDVSYCEKLVLPPATDKLVNLRHLHNFDSNNPLPKRIGGLIGLEILDDFVIGQNGEAANLDDLANLDCLRGRFCKTGWFCISGLENVSYANDLEKAQLEKKTRLSTLKLAFGGGRAEWRKSHDEELIEALRTPPNLEGLWLFDCQATRIFSCWMMSLSNLTTLRLTNCINCELLPPLGKLPVLEFLHLWGMPGVKEIGAKFLGIETAEDAISSPVVAFPKLTKLYFVKMENWEGWIDDFRRNGDEDSMKIIIMPCLQHLCLSQCPKLEALPFYVLQKTTLNKLDISSGCRILEKRYDKGIGKDWLKISHIPNVNISHTIF